MNPMNPSSPVIVPQEKTRVAIQAMMAYFNATDQARPRQERQRLAGEWLAAIRRMRSLQ